MQNEGAELGNVRQDKNNVKFLSSEDYNSVREIKLIYCTEMKEEVSAKLCATKLQEYTEYQLSLEMEINKTSKDRWDF